MRISDWSSDVCSSDLVTVIGTLKKEGDDMFGNSTDEWVIVPLNFARNMVNIRSESSNPDIWVRGKDGVQAAEVEAELRGVMRSIRQIGRASCRERVCQTV